MDIGRAKDIRGKRYGHWTVLERAENNANGTPRWLCKCDCGTIREVDAGHLKNGKSTNCGCVARQNTRERNLLRDYRQEEKPTRPDNELWKSFTGMHRKCEKEYARHYEIFGGRCISVCAEWSGEKGYENFKEWSESNGYNADLPKGECTLSRHDIDGDFNPDNCYWATRNERANNRRNSRKITLNDETHTLTEWSKIKGISDVTIRKRLREGWSVEKALNEPVNSKKRNKFAFAYGE